jgi:hypothetical protein
MATIRHPVTGKPRLDWNYDGTTGVQVASVVRQAKYRKGHAYDVATVFAYLRPAYNSSGVFHEHAGWVVTRNSFDEIREFDNFDTAKLYIESLFALEYGAE